MTPPASRPVIAIPLDGLFEEPDELTDAMTEEEAEEKAGAQFARWHGVPILAPHVEAQLYCPDSGTCGADSDHDGRCPVLVDHDGWVSLTLPGGVIVRPIRWDTLVWDGDTGVQDWFVAIIDRYGRPLWDTYWYAVDAPVPNLYVCTDSDPTPTERTVPLDHVDLAWINPPGLGWPAAEWQLRMMTGISPVPAR